MLESAEFDDELMEKYFDDPSTITEELRLSAIRKGTISMEINPMLCGSSFKNKGCSDICLMLFAHILPSPSGYWQSKVQILTLIQKRKTRKPDDSEPTVLWHSRLLQTHMLDVLVFFRVYSGKVACRKLMFIIHVQVKKNVSAACSR
jgi:elongation factor G